ncbi:transporter substrate-binding domain-containing protein [Marinobacter sp. TBZ242]|uniref:Transporter substrate-binding domain-containing protein n=1 Tax=Marinobacter azerbaijanicus TaxID=3050455 RepID=A0ABT7ICE4_9GAMM|nr:transporter substrate-binding domain-containing protein [Marinobacter sp. TBZ242]MDL0431829.1 transporter substrate-binding domain-containing protein [Marinobacter sp. TBZ242]
MMPDKNDLWFLPFVVALSVLSPANASPAPPCQTLTVSGNPEYPPLLWRDSQAPGYLVGAVPTLLKEIVEPLGLELVVRDIGSWARVQHVARLGDIDMLAGAFITSERIRYMDYLLPPITHLPTVVWVPKGGEFVYRHWPDLLGKRGSTLINNSFGQNFDRYADENLHIEGVRSIEQSFQMALAGRVDYVLYESLQGQVTLEKMGIADDFSALETPISREGLFFTFAKASPCNTFELRERIADRLATMVASGRIDQLIREYSKAFTGAD